MVLVVNNDIAFAVAPSSVGKRLAEYEGRPLVIVLERAIPVTIPRVIHQIWVGPADPPLHWIEGWRLPGWEHLLWREHDLTQLTMRNSRVFHKYMSMGTWHGASDVARVEILSEIGGVFIDADIEMIKPLDGAPWLEAPMFAVEDPGTGLLANGVMGSRPGDATMLRYRHEIGRVRRRHPYKRRRMYPPWQRVGPGLLTHVSAACPGKVTVVESAAFFPEDRYGRPLPGGGTVYGRHHWMTTRIMLGADRPESKDLPH
jgi:hypothetical protein